VAVLVVLAVGANVFVAPDTTAAAAPETGARALVSVVLPVGPPGPVAGLAADGEDCAGTADAVGIVRFAGWAEALSGDAVLGCDAGLAGDAEPSGDALRDEVALLGVLEEDAGSDAAGDWAGWAGADVGAAAALVPVTAWAAELTTDLAALVMVSAALVTGPPWAGAPASPARADPACPDPACAAPA
jgi:hypothetical protein